ncbi:MAG: hypothetical protein NZ528_17040 [Caldilineales bacterium]|nr:hypothetical protein [Caldilineales bacterium]
MAQFAFLQDEETRSAIAHMAAEAAKVWAPSEVDLAYLITEEYLDQVQEADRLLYAAPARELSLGIGEPDLWLLVILPVLTGFMANLLAAFSAWSLHTLRERLAAQSAPPPASAALHLPDEVRRALATQAEAAGLSGAQIEQLLAILLLALAAALSGSSKGGGAA